MNTNEQQWQECPLEEATHARTATGHIFAVEENRGLRYTRVKDALIFPEMLPLLGITPVRKAEVKPVEFVRRAERIGTQSLAEIVVIQVPYEWEGMTFNLVQVQP